MVTASSGRQMHASTKAAGEIEHGDTSESLNSLDIMAWRVPPLFTTKVRMPIMRLVAES
jgi:hypothetical protein